MSTPLRVLVVDDSAFMRKLISTVLDADPQITVIGQARNGMEAIKLVKELAPDVVTMDVEMPEMNGIDALRRIMAEKATPVVMLSSLTQEGARTTMQCLEIGAVDFVGKPSGSLSLNIDPIVEDLVAKIKAAARARLHSRTIVSRPYVDSRPAGVLRRGVLLIGSSTGGPKALLTVVPMLPADLGVPIVIVQHMPPGFTASLAKRLDADSKIRVKEAAEGDRLQPNVALLAPGGRHLLFGHAGVAQFSDGPLVHGVRPSVDVAMDSLVHQFGKSVVAAILTGMGRDGAAGFKALHDKGGYTIAEAEETCVVYGMPRAAVELGAITKQVPLQDIAKEIVSAVTSLSREGSSIAAGRG